jgi:hypothetical protein
MRVNLDKIICINLESVNTQQLFAICETYFIGFEELYRRKKETKVSMYWMIEGKIIAFIIGGFFRLGSNFESLSKEDQDKIKAIKPVKTPKMPKTEQALRNYKAFLAEGYDIRTTSMDSKLYNLESRKESVYVKYSVKEVFVEDFKKNLPVVLEVDAILEKIFKYGIDSITLEEKNLLDNH